MSEQKQTDQLSAMILQNKPEMTTAQMQRWISDPKGLQNFLAGLVEKRWTEKDNILYFTLTSNGKTGEEWITHLEGKGLPVGDYAKSILRHESFKPTKAGTVHNIAVIKGETFSDDERITKNIRAYAKNQKMTTLPADVACLIRDNFTDEEIKEMGLTWIITMHEPIPVSDGGLSVLGASRYGDCRLSAYSDDPGGGWSRGLGFAFAVSQGTLS